MTDCAHCVGVGIEPNIGGLCVRCDGSGKRRPGSDPFPGERAHIIHCICGFLVAFCPASMGGRCPPHRNAADTLAVDIVAMLRQLGLRVITAEEARREIPPPPPPPLYPPDGGGR